MKTKRNSLLLLGLFWMISTALALDPQVEFVAELVEIERESEEVALLKMQLTPDVTLGVLVTPRTEITGEDGLPLTLDDLVAGLILDVSGIFADQGILALKLKVTDDENDFTVKGPIQEVSPAVQASTATTNAGGVFIVVANLPILVPESADIQNSQGTPLTPQDLMVGQFVRVDGMNTSDGLVARRVRIRDEHDGFARIRLQGFVEEIIGPRQFILKVEGDAQALIHITEDTEIHGTLAVGVYALVLGVLQDDLSVKAGKIFVRQVFDVRPARLRMTLDAEKRAHIVLLGPLDHDAVFRLGSKNPEIAAPLADQVLIPAGQLTESFGVESFDTPGRTEIDVTLDGLTQSVEVFVGAEPDPDGLRLSWIPKRIQGTPQGLRPVHLAISEPAPEDLRVRLELRDSPDDLIAIPDSVEIPAGQQRVEVRIDVLGREGQGRVHAQLPDSVGGASDELTVVIEKETDEALEIAWDPNEIKLVPDSQGRVVLKLSRPVPAPIQAAITLRRGDRTLVRGFPRSVTFREGESEVIIEFATADAQGEVHFRAALPRRVGGDHDDLVIEVSGR